ncbi:hypothetical protein LIER_08597 [Lithospermum erythrorhizon]|uniref:Uncharacterized protein n=1 Tax=Lithospermum erythrorhizon TaxID=34254 RepID=A0AAV3PCG4_LITER
MGRNLPCNQDCGPEEFSNMILVGDERGSQTLLPDGVGAAQSEVIYCLVRFLRRHFRQMMEGVDASTRRYNIAQALNA